MNNDLTINELYTIFGRLLEHGYGDMKIYVDDFAVKSDEICFYYLKDSPKMLIRPLYSLRDKRLHAAQRLKNDIAVCVTRYFESV